MDKNISIGILGAGSFGTALAHLLASKGHNITLWARNEKTAHEIQTKNENQFYLPGIKLPKLEATSDLGKTIHKKDIILFAIPAQHVRETLLKTKNLISPEMLLVNTAKGIEQKTLMIPSQVFADVLGKKILERYAMVSGPTFAMELAQQNPSGASLASLRISIAKKIQTALSCPYFRLYTSEDVIGTELGGALKNVMAIGTGVAEGLGFGLNTRAGLMTRCLYEMTKLGVTMGAKAVTFSGLSGVGDLILTCTGHLSRNRTVGLELGKGKTLEEILKNLGHVAEGVATAQSVHDLAKKYDVEMTNAEYVYRMLYEGLSSKEALKEILMRELKEESPGL